MHLRFSPYLFYPWLAHLSYPFRLFLFHFFYHSQVFSSHRNGTHLNSNHSGALHVEIRSRYLSIPLSVQVNPALICRIYRSRSSYHFFPFPFLTFIRSFAPFLPFSLSRSLSLSLPLCACAYLPPHPLRHHPLFIATLLRVDLMNHSDDER
jgi:hypothetical protein